MHSMIFFLTSDALLAVLAIFVVVLQAGAEEPVLAAGYAAQVVASGLDTPRGLVFDTKGRLLVLQNGAGLVSLEFADRGGTNLSVAKQNTVINDTSLNHGLELSQDGKTLYASNATGVFSWAYDADKSAVSGKTVIVSGMASSGHRTRTLLLSRKIPGSILVSHGSDGNLDALALDETSGHSQIRAFNLSSVPSDGWSYNEQGVRVGWGLRNSVGVGEHPVTGGIYSVENSADQIQRQGRDVSRDNPGEEMNYHGTLNSSSLGGNYGYPTCFAAWGVNDIPDKGNLTVGAQFVLNTPNATINDTFCARERIPPRLTFQAHQAPIDIKFNNSGAEAWISFRGSWDRSDPVGYKVSVVPFSNGEPVARPDNTTAAIDILSNADLSKCPKSCFRPAGLAFDGQGRLFVSSDATGEIFVIVKQRSSGASPSGTFQSPTPSSTSSAPFTPRQNTAGLVILAIVSLLLI